MKVDIGNVKLARREFLKLTSASAVGGTLVGASATLQPLPRFSLSAHAASSTTAPPRIDVGYWDGRLASSFVDANQHDGAAPAAASARVTIATGCDPADLRPWDGYRAVGIRLNVAAAAQDGMQVWRHQVLPVPSASPLVAVDVPLDDANGMSGWVDYQAEDGVAAVPFHLGTNGLRGGSYLMLLSKPHALGRNDWSSLRLRVVDGGNALELRDGRGRLVRQPHVVFEVAIG